MSCKISSQISSRLRQLPLNLKIKKDIVLQLLTAARGRNRKKKKKEGMMLPNINSQMEVGSLGGWPDAAGTSEHWMSNSTPCLDTSFSRLVAGIPQQEWQRLVVHTYTSVCCLACSRLHHGKTFSLLFFFFLLFWVEPWEPAILKHTAQFSVPCLVFNAYVSDFTASSHSQLQSRCLGNRSIPLIAPPWYGWAWWSRKELLPLVTTLRRHSVLLCTAPSWGLFLNAAIASCAWLNY